MKLFFYLSAALLLSGILLLGLRETSAGSVPGKPPFPVHLVRNWSISRPSTAWGRRMIPKSCFS
jgi:hypothetical protein